MLSWPTYIHIYTNGLSTLNLCVMIWIFEPKPNTHIYVWLVTSLPSLRVYTSYIPFLTHSFVTRLFVFLLIWKWSHIHIFLSPVAGVIKHITTSKCYKTHSSSFHTHTHTYIQAKDQEREREKECLCRTLFVWRS